MDLWVGSPICQPPPDSNNQLRNPSRTTIQCSTYFSNGIALCINFKCNWLISFQNFCLHCSIFIITIRYRHSVAICSLVTKIEIIARQLYTSVLDKSKFRNFLYDLEYSLYTVINYVTFDISTCLFLCVCVCARACVLIYRCEFYLSVIIQNIEL